MQNNLRVFDMYQTKERTIGGVVVRTVSRASWISHYTFTDLSPWQDILPKYNQEDRTSFPWGMRISDSFDTPNYGIAPLPVFWALVILNVNWFGIWEHPIFRSELLLELNDWELLLYCSFRHVFQLTLQICLKD